MDHVNNDTTEQVKVTVLFFAKSRELVEQRSAQILLGKRLTGRDLIANILNNFPSLAVIEENLLIAVNQSYIEKDSEINFEGGEEVAVIPPISGG
ncbi:Molybdopterin synthase catalytic subunit [Desmophyllum pertusum]|uniref:Molybdopterin synthase catalytic subunit n=1 Tax=Desmophyllum pertusum TaxID=174260 RepID=A0A9X0D6Y0_9CNID|nr:Molybdopterin synthase catalytic subunit [Desmophyllum pertusum]